MLPRTLNLSLIVGSFFWGSGIQVFADVNYVFTGQVPDNAANHPMIDAGESYVAKFRIDDKKRDSRSEPELGLYFSAVQFGTVEFSGGYQAPYNFAGLQAVVLNNAQNSDSVAIQASGLAFAVGSTNFVDLDVLDSDALPQAGVTFDPAPIPYDGPIQLIQLIYTDSLGSVQYVANTQHDVDFAATYASDFNDDHLQDCQDIDALVAEIANIRNGEESSSVWFDVNGDGSVDAGDLDAWLEDAAVANLGFGRRYLPGDANLDGVVDVSDFNRWNMNQFTQAASWCSGDFDANGVVDVSDFNLWNLNKFRNGLSATAVVPETLSSWQLVLIGGALCLARRRA